MAALRLDKGWNAWQMDGNVAELVCAALPNHKFFSAANISLQQAQSEAGRLGVV